MESGLNAREIARKNARKTARNFAALRYGVFLFFAPLAALAALTVIVLGLKTYLLNEAAIRNAEAARNAAPFVETFFGNVYKSAITFFEKTEMSQNQNAQNNAEVFFSINGDIYALAEYNESGNVKSFFTNNSIPKQSLFYKDIETIVKERATEFNPVPFDKSLLFASEVGGRSVFVLRFITRQKTPAMVIFSSEEFRAAFSNNSVITFLFGGNNAEVELFSSLSLNEKKAFLEIDRANNAISAERVVDINGADYPLRLKVVTMILNDSALAALMKIKRVNILLAAIIVFCSFLAAWAFSRFMPEIRKAQEAEAASLQVVTTSESAGPDVVEQFFAVNDIKIELPAEGTILTRPASILFVNIDDAGGSAAALFKDCVQRAASLITRVGGEIETFTGGGLVAQFGLSVTKCDPPEDALNALCAALLIRANFRLLNKERTLSDLPKISVSCAVSSGGASSGKTADGQALLQGAGLTGRAESRAIPYGADILIAEETMRLAGKFFYTCEMPPLREKGAVTDRLFALVNVKDTLTRQKMLDLCAFFADNGEGEAKVEAARALFGGEGPRTMMELRRTLAIPTPNLRLFLPIKAELRIVRHDKEGR
jgi:class 3 adenylate cyclase